MVIEYLYCFLGTTKDDGLAVMSTSKATTEKQYTSTLLTSPEREWLVENVNWNISNSYHGCPETKHGGTRGRSYWTSNDF